MEDVFLTALTTPQVRQMFREELEKFFTNTLKAEAEAPPLIVDGDYLEEKLQVTRHTLGRWRKQNKIPFIQQGSVIRYDYNKVIEALEGKKGGRK